MKNVHSRVDFNRQKIISYLAFSVLSLAYFLFFSPCPFYLLACLSQAYLSILYLKPRTQIILRGKKIQAKLVAKRLIHIEHDVYKPHFSVSLRYVCVCNSQIQV